jgi:branched-chain amino acid transport system ATP-binding protein
MNILEVEDVSLSFGGIYALCDVSFSVMSSEVFAIIGPNGSGKTSLFNCISGIYRPDRGRIEFKGIGIIGMKPDKVASLGISRTFQNIKLFSNMTCFGNILLGRHIKFSSGILRVTFGADRSEYVKHRRFIEDIVDFLGLQAFRDVRVADVPMGVQRKVELARALASEPELVLLDEPTAGLTSEEKMEFSYYIREIRGRMGITVVVIEHDVKVVSGISDRMIALNYGMKIAEGSPQDVCGHPEVVSSYLGA